MMSKMKLKSKVANNKLMLTRIRFISWSSILHVQNVTGFLLSFAQQENVKHKMQLYETLVVFTVTRESRRSDGYFKNT